MGQEQSTAAAHASARAGGGEHGVRMNVAFHVLRVAERSPAAEAGIEPFFDFIVGVNGKPLGDDIDMLTQTLEQDEGYSISLQIWSTKRKELRDVQVVPSRQWAVSSGAPSSSSSPSLLGLSLRVCNPQHALEQVWHVLEILEGSPAESAGLVPFGDWIIGYAGGVLRGEGDFYDVVEAHVDKPLRLFVYNADYDVTREAILVPNRSWGGEGLLGCGVGYGLLHRIPKPQDRNVARSQQQPPPPPRAGSMSSSNVSNNVVSPPPSSSRKLNAAVSPPPMSTSATRQMPMSNQQQTTVAPPPPRATRNESIASSQAGGEEQEGEWEDEEDVEIDDERQGPYSASEGVSVIPMEMSENGSFYTPPSQYQSSQPRSGNVRSNGGGSYYGNTSGGVVSTGVIREEAEEGMV